MEPYATPFYFVILGLALLPLIMAHAYGKKWMGYQVILTIAFLWISFGGKVSLWSLLGFGIFETTLIKLYEHYRKLQNKTWVFVLAVIASLLPLIIVKVTPLLDPMHPQSILGFLGISYVTFKTVSVILELRDGLIKEVPLKEYLYFLYFFPTISSGPIDRFRRFQKELEAPLTDKYSEYLGKGIFYIFQGFLYNFIISYLISHYFLHDLAIKATLHPNLWNMMGSMYAYGFYLFFNFAGYSLFAMGVSLIMGYKIPINFNKPFLAKNINDFWQRWHISLSFWFRDFVFMRLVKWIMVKKWSKNMVTISNVGYLVNMFIMGCWHGLTWYYILYGVYHTCLMISYDAWKRMKKKHKWNIPDNMWTRGAAIFITFNAVMVSFLIFSGIPNYAIMHAINGLGSPLPNF